MKLKIHCPEVTIAIKQWPDGVDITISTHSIPPAEARSVSPLLEQRINACTSLSELLHLLFTTTEKTEAVMALFDQKMEALEKEGFSIHQPFKTNNNGSTSSAQLA